VTHNQSVAGGPEGDPPATGAPQPPRYGMRMVTALRNPRSWVPRLDHDNPHPTLRTERIVALTIGAFRVAQHLPFIAVAAGGWNGYSYADLSSALWVVSLAWTLFLFTFAYRRGGLRPPWALADVAFAMVITVAVGRMCLPGQELTWDNWSVGPAVGAGAVAALYLRPRLAVPSVMLIAAAYVVGINPSTEDPQQIAQSVGNVAGLLIYPFAAGIAAATLRKSAREAERASQSEFALRLERETEQRLADERVRQYRLLHDTVLSTLSTVARGGLDHRAPEVQKRCADDADLLRGLITGMAHDVPTSLASALSEVSRAHADLGLEVRQQYAGLPDSLPPEVIEALAHAVREALNNVAKHAKTRDAWVTATGDDYGAVRVTVTDRGRGFDSDSTRAGFGINQSIRGRMLEAGGDGHVRSWAGEGTEVELQWPTTHA
jgi:signal transduction histidine kinase